MMIYDVALLSFCMLAGVFVSVVLDQLIGVRANVGGVGIPVLLLISLSNLSHHRLKLTPITESAVNFWSAIPDLGIQQFLARRRRGG